MLGENLDDNVEMKDVLVEMGIYGQMQDDYHDTFGDPNVVGQIGSDIENSKSSWLIAKALELANDEQKKILCRVYEDYENKTHEELLKSIESIPCKPIHGVLKSLLSYISGKIGRSLN
ncbi:putative transferase [Helianthus annuus]|nr:putative transferase [Helianthus annuus]